MPKEEFLQHPVVTDHVVVGDQRIPFQIPDPHHQPEEEPDDEQFTNPYYEKVIYICECNV